MTCLSVVFFFQAEEGIRDLVRSRGLGDVYKREVPDHGRHAWALRGQLRLALDERCDGDDLIRREVGSLRLRHVEPRHRCLLYTSDAADERSSVDLGGRRILKKKTNKKKRVCI